MFGSVMQEVALYRVFNIGKLYHGRYRCYDVGPLLVAVYYNV